MEIWYVTIERAGRSPRDIQIVGRKRAEAEAIAQAKAHNDCRFTINERAHVIRVHSGDYYRSHGTRPH